MSDRLLAPVESAEARTRSSETSHASVPVIPPAGASAAPPERAPSTVRVPQGDLG